MAFTFLLGGARSGKSELAVQLALSFDGPVVVLVTAEARDDEMAERIRRHRGSRPSGWTTVEAPLGLAAALHDLRADACVVLDCVTIWVANAIEAGLEDDAVLEEASQVVAMLAKRDAPGVVVSNEVGLGIVPVNALARRYRDTLGRANAVFAAGAAHALLVVSGRALRLEEATLA